MMIENSEQENSTKKLQEGNTSDGKISKASSSLISWSRLKDQRIVHVSRAFGGKDRHSKVYTVRGLRDRRIRLSVATAIQLYDLQDRLGVNQPSKVVDWLLNATKHEIDELPPLQIPPSSGNFSQSPPQTVITSQEIVAPQLHELGFRINSSLYCNEPVEPSRSNFWSSEKILWDKSKEPHDDKENWRKRDEYGKQVDVQSPFNNLFQKCNYSSLLGLPNNAMPYNSFQCWDPPDLSLSHSENNGLCSHREDSNYINSVTLPPTSFITSGSHVLSYPSETTQSSYLPTNIVTSSMDFDPKQINFQIVTSTSQYSSSNFLTQPLLSMSQPMRPFSFSMATNILPFQNNNGRKPNKNNQ